MAAYNSRVGALDDDSDISIIHPSMTDEYVDNTQITNSQSNNNQPVRPSGVGSNEYIFIDHDPLQDAKKLEEILMFYIGDLKKETNSQLDCDKQLITRIMDLIRSAYLNDQQKMIQLDKIVEEIGQLHDKRHIEQQEKLEQLRADRNRLNRMMFPTGSDQQIVNNRSKNYSMFSTLQGYQSTDVEQWTEIEDDAKKLHELVESQRNQINEIVSLISQAAASSSISDPPSASEDNKEKATADTILPTTPDKFMLTDLLKKIGGITRNTMIPRSQPQPTVTTDPKPNTQLLNHSPGASPSESLNTLTYSTLQSISVNPKADDEKPVENVEPVKEEPVANIKPVKEKPLEVINVPVPQPPPVPTPPPEAKKCPVCNHEFPPTCDDVEMYDHIERCLFPSGAAVVPKDYECPNCNRKFPGNDDSAYIQHLSDCYNQGF